MVEGSILATSTLADDVVVFRRFNRLYTRFIGTLNGKLLDSEFSLAEARVLYELATRSAPKASDIANDLGLDPGYLSRLLGKFKRNRILRREISRHDGRFSELALTSRGKSAFKGLNARSDEQAGAVLGGLPELGRMQLIRAMQAIEGILAGSRRSARTFNLRPHRVGDMGWIVHREGLDYAEQFGWDQTFEALVAHITADFIANFDPDRERCWIAESDGANLGHIFLVKHPAAPDIAKLRLLFVEPSARGAGIGEALVEECVRFARTAGYRKVVLWTQSILVAAHRIYEKAGFRLLKEEPHHSFGQDLIGQEWELELT